MRDELNLLYGGKIPDYIRDAGKTYLTIRAGSDYGGVRDSKITVQDVAYYYANDAQNITSGCRSLGGVTGDWRPIDGLAMECLAWFKAVNIEGLRKAGKALGLTPNI